MDDQTIAAVLGTDAVTAHITTPDQTIVVVLGTDFLTARIATPANIAVIAAAVFEGEEAHRQIESVQFAAVNVAIIKYAQKEAA